MGERARPASLLNWNGLSGTVCRGTATPRVDFSQLGVPRDPVLGCDDSLDQGSAVTSSGAPNARANSSIPFLSWARHRSWAASSSSAIIASPVSS